MSALAKPVAELVLPQGRCLGGELEARGHERARFLRGQGLRKGNLVICKIGGATAEFGVMQTALAISRATLLPVANGLGNADCRELAAHTGADWMWEATNATDSQGIGGEKTHGRLLATGRAGATGARPKTAEYQESLALVVQTSGSTGGRKAAMLSEGALQASCQRVNQRLGLGAGDLWLCALPRQHIGGLAIGYRCALAGAGMLLHARFDAERVAADLWRYPVTHLSLVPAMLARLLERCQRPPKWLRVALVGGQALDATLAHQALAAGWPLHLGYGMTETCSFIASRALTENAEQELRPLPDVVLEAPRCASDSKPAPLRLRAPMLMSGYANPRRRLGLGLDDNGYFRTGDLACLTHASNVRILGRADDQLIIAGVNVHPGPIAERISGLTDVTQCALVGLPEPVWGRTLVALYRGTAHCDALERWCREHLPGHERPRLFVPVEDWPLLASGKDDRTRLRAIATAAWERHCLSRKI